MTWLMEIIKVWQEEQFLIKYCVIEHLILLQIRNMMGIRGLASVVYKFFDKYSSGSGIKNENMSDQQLADVLHKPSIRKF